MPEFGRLQREFH